MLERRRVFKVACRRDRFYGPRYLNIQRLNYLATMRQGFTDIPPPGYVA